MNKQKYIVRFKKSIHPLTAEDYLNNTLLFNETAKIVYR